MSDERLLFDKGRGGNPAVAVFVSLYNYEKTIVAALESVARQSLNAIELLVVDDCSGDASAFKALEWMELHFRRFTRCQLIQQPSNRGSMAAHNINLAHARAPYLFMLDADNEIYPRCLERLKEALDENTGALAYSLLESFGEHSRLLAQDLWERELFALGNAVDMMALLRRTALVEIGGFPDVKPRVWDDYELWSRFIEKNMHGVQVPEILGRYRFHSDSKSKRLNPQEVEAVMARMRRSHPWITVGLVAGQEGLQGKSEPRSTGRTESFGYLVKTGICRSALRKLRGWMGRRLNKYRLWFWLRKRWFGTQGFRISTRLDRYEAWLAVNAWGAKQEANLRERLAEASGLPLISLVTPVYRPAMAHFLQTVQSVRGQVHGGWEWCLADDAAGVPELTACLTRLAKEDSRIRFVTRLVNGNISLATNTAASLAGGEYLAFLDHDDLLTPDCLGEIALALAAHPEVDLLYTDDDKMDDQGRRYDPQFKPEWSPETLLSHMYLSHLLVIRRSLFESLGGLRQGYEGSQDHDLALRAAERIDAVLHLPLVLYHWRAVKGSLASSADAKPHSLEAGRKAVNDALRRRGSKGTAESPSWAAKAKLGYIRHRFPDDGPRVAVLIATRNRVDLLRSCVASLDKTSYRNYEIFILDDGSDDPETLAYLAAFPGKVIRDLRPRNGFSHSSLHNHAAGLIDADYLLFLNNDTEALRPDWMSQMVGFGGMEGVGAVGARLLYPDGTVQHAGVLNGFSHGEPAIAFRNVPGEAPGYMGASKTCRNYGAVTAACMLTPRKLFLEMGGFDEDRFPVSFNDVDYCFRLTARGLRCVYAAEAELTHAEGSSRGLGSSPWERAVFRELYSSKPERYYNLNLSMDRGHFEVRTRRVARRGPTRIRSMVFSHALDLTGAPLSLFELVQALSGRGELEPVVVAFQDGPLRAWYEAAGVPVHILESGLASVRHMRDYERVIDDFRGRIAASGVEVVLANTIEAFHAIDAAKSMGLPSVWIIHESEPWRSRFNSLPVFVAKRALECFAFPYQTIFVSDASREVYRDLDSRGNFRVIRGALHPERWAELTEPWSREAARGRLGLEPGNVVVLLLGTVCERKGQADFLEALAKLPPEAAGKLECFIVGDRSGDYSSFLRRLISGLPHALQKRIHLLPETREVGLYYGAADIFVCSSRVESYPRVTLEAMVSGLPIVSTPVFGLSEQLAGGINAIFYEPGDSAALARNLGELILNPEKRRDFSAASPVVLRSLPSFKEMIDAYSEVFREAAEVGNVVLW